MKILFVGASSFTGYWFVKELIKNDHSIVSTFTKDSLDSYAGIRNFRVSELTKISTPVWGCKFGDEQFIKLVNKESFDTLCLHASFVENYKSDQFDFIYALKNNTFNIEKVFNLLQENKCNTIILTGSVFEQNEGVGSNNNAISPYGLSKGLTYEVVKYYAKKYKIKLGKFVIPNPFGPYEEPRFVNYLVKEWKEDNVPIVKTPKYIRDNIHVSLLGKYYSRFLENVHNSDLFFQKVNPSGYVESQGDFTKRVAEEIRKRTGLMCKYILSEQKSFEMPIVKINTDNTLEKFPEWNEEQAWNDIVTFYMNDIL